MYPIINIVNLYLEINNKIILDNINIGFINNNIYALVGDNGSGKTTFFKTILGLYKQCNKNIFLDDKNLNFITNKDIAKKFSFLSQNNQSSSYCTAEYRISHGLMPLFGFDYWLLDSQKEMIKNIAKKLCIEHLLHRSINQLSGGEQRLVNIAKSLVNPYSQVIILDEPSVYLDFKQKKNLIEYLLSICSKEKIIIFSSHDQDFISNCSTKILYLKNKNILN